MAGGRVIYCVVEPKHERSGIFIESKKQRATFLGVMQ